MAYLLTCLQVSRAGSVVVEKLMEVERYSHVMHISSTGAPYCWYCTAALWGWFCCCALRSCARCYTAPAQPLQ